MILRRKISDLNCDFLQTSLKFCRRAANPATARVLNVNRLSLPTKNFIITPSLRVQKEDWDAPTTEIVT